MRNRRQTRSACSYFSIFKIINFVFDNISRNTPAYATIILLASKALFAEAQVPTSGLVFALPPVNTSTNTLVYNNVQQINFGDTNAGFAFNQSSNSSVYGTGVYPGDYSSTSFFIRSLLPMQGTVISFNSGGYAVMVNPEFYNASYVDPNAPYFNCGRGFLKIIWQGLEACGPTLSIPPSNQNWTHYAITIGYPESVFVYLNGTFVEALEFTTSVSTPSRGPGYIVGMNFTGQLANVWVFDSALTPSQIASIYSFQSNALINNLSLAAPSSSGLVSSSIFPSSSAISSNLGITSSTPISSSNPSSSVSISSSVATSSKNPSSSVSLSSSISSSSIAETPSSSATASSSSTGRMLSSILTAVSSIATAASSSLLASSSTPASSLSSESTSLASSSASSSSQFESSGSSGTNEIQPDEVKSSSTNYPTYAKALTGIGAGGVAIAGCVVIWCCCFVGRKRKGELVAQEEIATNATQPAAIEMFQVPSPG